MAEPPQSVPPPLPRRPPRDATIQLDAMADDILSELSSAEVAALPPVPERSVSPKIIVLGVVVVLVMAGLGLGLGSVMLGGGAEPPPASSAPALPAPGATPEPAASADEGEPEAIMLDEVLIETADEAAPEGEEEAAPEGEPAPEP